MKKIINLFYSTVALLSVIGATSCSDEKEGGGHHDWASDIIFLNNVPNQLIGGPTAYGANLYYGAKDQITSVMQPCSDFFVQFPINYGSTYDENFNPVWGYSFYNGGIAVSNWHDMEDGSYLNQLSVYSKSSPSGGNFLIAFGRSEVTDPNSATYSDYSGCAHIYLTDENGYTVKNLGEPDTQVSGQRPRADETFFTDIAVANTTYAYLTMKNGNNYAEAFNTDNKGWFKVQFIAFEDDDPNGKPVGYVESYLANFDYNLNQESGLNRKIRDDWYEVDLSSLPIATILVINFVGSDMGEYGLNTPSYCALDKLGITYW